MNKDAAGLGRGGGLGLFFGRGSWGSAGKPFGFRVGCPFFCSGVDFSALAVDVATSFVSCSGNKVVEATCLLGGFIMSLGLISSGI